MVSKEIDLTDKKKFKDPVACVWWMGGVRNACGEPLGPGDKCFCPKHRDLASNWRYRDVAGGRYYP
jgi:hypothetical protein